MGRNRLNLFARGHQDNENSFKGKEGYRKEDLGLIRQYLLLNKRSLTTKASSTIQETWQKRLEELEVKIRQAGYPIAKRSDGSAEIRPISVTLNAQAQKFHEGLKKFHDRHGELFEQKQSRVFSAKL